MYTSVGFVGCGVGDLWKYVPQSFSTFFIWSPKFTITGNTSIWTLAMSLPKVPMWKWRSTIAHSRSGLGGFFPLRGGGFTIQEYTLSRHAVAAARHFSARSMSASKLVTTGLPTGPPSSPKPTVGEGDPPPLG